jgi:Fur family transcriptional regulator, ferric uptake regulator
MMLAALTQAGYSNTRARRAVLEALVNAGGHATPAELLEGGRAYHPELGLVTVYRTVDILAVLGLVRKLHLEEGCHAYALSPAGVQAAATHDAEAGNGGENQAAHGHHVICQRCHRAVEFDGCDIAGIIAAAEAQTGFDVRTHLLEMFGICPACRGEVE